MNNPIIVFLDSDEFGCETFERETIESALASIKQLWLNYHTFIETKKDGIERKIGIIINSQKN